MDAKERKRIGRLIQILELFKERNSTIPLQQVITFLRVARTPGIGVTEVAHASQTHIASASRHVQALRGSEARRRHWLPQPMARMNAPSRYSSRKMAAICSAPSLPRQTRLLSPLARSVL